MKSIIAGAVALAISAVAVPALAQTPAPAAAASAAMSVENTPIETLAANEKAKAAIEKEFPGITTHEAYPQFKAMTLAQVAPMSQGMITDEKMKALQAELDKIK